MSTNQDREVSNIKPLSFEENERVRRELGLEWEPWLNSYLASLAKARAVYEQIHGIRCSSRRPETIYVTHEEMQRFEQLKSYEFLRPTVMKVLDAMLWFTVHVI